MQMIKTEYDQARAGIELLQNGAFSSALETFRTNVEHSADRPADLDSLLAELPSSSHQALIELLGAIPRLCAHANSVVGVTQLVREKQDATPFTRSPIKIDRSKVIVVLKKSKVELDMECRHVSYDELLRQYSTGGEDKERIVKSHERQMEALREFQRLFAPHQLIGRDQLSREKCKSASLIIALGGDNHFQYISHFITGDTPIIGVNSDPRTSFGAMLQCSAAEIAKVMDRLERGAYRFEPWTKLKISLDGATLPSALGEILLGEAKRKEMSRHTLKIQGGAEPYTPVEQKSSGLLISTGAGSTGWYKAAGRYAFKGDPTFPKTAPYARFLLTEASGTVVQKSGEVAQTIPPYAVGRLRAGETLIVQSLNDSNGIASTDSLEEAPFPRGAVARIEIDPQPLWVTCPLQDQDAV